MIFEQKGSVHLLSLPLWAVYGVNALELARCNPDPARLQHLVDAWRGRYRNIYFVHTYRTNLCGLFLQHVEDMSFGTYEWERAYASKPQGPEPRELHFQHLARRPAVGSPGAAAARDRHRRLRRRPGLRLLRQGRRRGPHLPLDGHLRVRVSARARAEATKSTVTTATGRRPATVAGAGRPCPSGARRSAGSKPAGNGRSTRLRLPDPLPPGPPVLRFDVPTFRPANVWPGDADTRDLGVMVDRIRLTIPVSRTAGGSP